MMKFWILVILGVLMCSLESARSEPAKPANIKKKNINIELNVNLGLGNESCVYKCAGPCYPGCTNNSYPGPLTHIPNTPRHRNFEKVGEYIKVRLCSYLYDDGKTCEFYCALLGYLRYTCVDLDTCHCFKKSNVPIMTRPGTISDQCTDDNQCMDYCLMKNHDVYECHDGQCRCSVVNGTPPDPIEPIVQPNRVKKNMKNNTSVPCNPSIDNDYDCMDHCHKKGYNDYDCRPDRTCSCFNTEDTAKPGSEVTDGTHTHYEDTTEELDHGDRTEEPHHGDTTEEPHHGDMREEPKYQDTTEEPDHALPPPPKEPGLAESPVDAAAPDDRHNPVKTYNCSEACRIRCNETNRPIARCGEDPNSCDCFAPPPPPKEPGIAQRPVDAATRVVVRHNAVKTYNCSEACRIRCKESNRPIAHCGEDPNSCDCFALPPPPKEPGGMTESPVDAVTLAPSVEMACNEKDGNEKCKKYCSSRGSDTYECQNGTCQCIQSFGIHSNPDSGACQDEECVEYCQGLEFESGHCKSGNWDPSNTDPSPCECTGVGGSTKVLGSCDPDKCTDHCRNLGYRESECLIDEDYPDDIPDEPCRCIGETKSHESLQTEMACDVEGGQMKCKDFCVDHEFPVYECSDGVCLCYHPFQRRTSPVDGSTTRGNEITISVPCTWEDEGKSCSADCKRRKFQVFECLGDAECHCFKPDFLSAMKPFAIRRRSRGVKHRNRRRVGRMFRRR